MNFDFGFNPSEKGGELEAASVNEKLYCMESYALYILRRMKMSQFKIRCEKFSCIFWQQDL